MSKEHPIIFSAPMIRAILDGRKTQTRRLVKRDKMPECDALMRRPEACPEGTEFFMDMAYPTGPVLRCTCPYGSRSDTLWVRETWNRIFKSELCPGESLGKTGEECVRDNRGFGCACCDGVVYRADGEWEHPEFGKPLWRSPIHMPRWASRITLEVVSVRVQRVQDISEADAIAEGAERNVVDGEEASWQPDWGYQTRCIHYPEGCECFPHETAREWYAELWDSINGAGSWDSNPWVWAVEFKRKDGVA